MGREIYRTLFICLSSFYTSEHWMLVESRLANQETMKTTELAKEQLKGNETELGLGTIVTAAVMAGSSIGIGMAALPNELSSREMNFQDQLNGSNISETRNISSVFGMPAGSDIENDEDRGRILSSRQNDTPNQGVINPSYLPDDGELDNSSSANTSWTNIQSDLNQTNEYFSPSENFMNSSLMPYSDDTGVTEKSKDEYETHKTTTVAPESTYLLEGTQDIVMTPRKLNLQMGLCQGIALISIAMFVIWMKNMTKNPTMEPTIADIGKVCRTDVKCQLELTTTVDHAPTGGSSSAAGICQPYTNSSTVCCKCDEAERKDCEANIIKCINDYKPVNGVSTLNGCAETKNGVPISSYLFEKLKGQLNRGNKMAKNVLGLDCIGLVGKNVKNVRKMARIYGCRSNKLQYKVLADIFNSCESLKRGETSIANICHVQKNINHLGTGRELLNKDALGGMGTYLQSGFIHCTKIYDRPYFEEYFSPNVPEKN